MNNIAEGFERQTDKEFNNFLNIAKGSAGEVRSMLYIAKDLNYMSDTQFNELMEKIISISKLIQGFRKYLKQ